MESKIIMGLMFVFSAMISQAQNNMLIPPDMTSKTYSFVLPELQIDSIFIANLNAVLFDEKDRVMDMIISNPDNRWRHFHVLFEKKDSLNYHIEVSLWDIPARKSIAFFDHNRYFYWVGGEIPSNIILETRSKKQFTYKDPLPAPYDPPFWCLIYNIQDGSIKVKEKTF